MSVDLEAILRPTRLWSRQDVLTTACVPRSPGVYGWYFREVPPLVPTMGCITQGGSTLLYVGIAPKAPPANGAAPSSQTLSKRIRYHYRGNAYGSTLRLTLGCLLAGALGIELRRVGSGHRLTFANGEAALSEWMALNAFVCWIEAPSPWLAESKLIADLNLPLNLAENAHHPFHPTLTRLRKDAKRRAMGLPIWQPTSM